MKVDFVMRMPAASAAFAAADESGEYRLTLRGASPTVRVTELTTAEDSASLPLNALMAYWTGYGDVTGQFTKNPPRAVVQGTDAEGNLVEVVVRLRDASRKAATVRFGAEVITNPEALRKVQAKVDDVDQTDIGEHAIASDPARLTDIELFVDMPPKITQPEAGTARKTTRQADASQTATPRNLRCNGVVSSRLRTCWDDITVEQAQTWPRTCSRAGLGRCPENWPLWETSGPANGWVYQNVGVVDWGNYYWAPGPRAFFFMSDIRYIGPMRDVEVRYAKRHTWWGVDTEAVTWYTTDRCTWFVARWEPGGPCW